MHSIIVDLQILAEEYQRLYQGSVRDVVARSCDGRRIRFPALILRPYVTHTGIQGRFRILFDDNNRFNTIEKID